MALRSLTFKHTKIIYSDGLLYSYSHDILDPRSLASRLNMSGSVTLVTGAAGFIGREICYSLAELGSDLILLDVNLSSLDQLKDDILQSYDVDVEIFRCDLADQASYTHISSFIEERFGRLDVLVNMQPLVELCIGRLVN